MAPLRNWLYGRAEVTWMTAIGLQLARKSCPSDAKNLFQQPARGGSPLWSNRCATRCSAPSVSDRTARHVIGHRSQVAVMLAARGTTD
jgi:hypothetical protein